MNSIRKGKNFERQMCKYLTKMLGAKFSRVPNSGAMQTSDGIQDFRFRGDIFTEDERYNWIVFECKVRATPIHLSELFEEPQANNLNGYLMQVWRNANVDGILGNSDNWCLFVKTDYSRYVYMFTSNDTLLNELANDIIDVSGEDYVFNIGIIEIE